MISAFGSHLVFHPEMTVYLDSEIEAGKTVVFVTGPGVRSWVQRKPRVLGRPWKVDGEDCAFVWVESFPELVESLQQEGYKVQP